MPDLSRMPRSLRALAEFPECHLQQGLWFRLEGAECVSYPAPASIAFLALIQAVGDRLSSNKQRSYSCRLRQFLPLFGLNLHGKILARPPKQH